MFNPECPYCEDLGEWCGCEDGPEVENDYGSGMHDEWSGQEYVPEEESDDTA